MADRIYTCTFRDVETRARLGYIDLPHGRVETPAFMPVGTNGTVKGIYHDRIRDIGYQIILANTYHLYLRPGEEVLKRFGGLHRFSNWNRNILTDSGGFQVFSLSGLRKVRDAGVTFQSHIDGSRHVFTPEKVVDIQAVIGSDIAMVLDVCTPPGIEYRNAKEAWRVTRLWAERSIEERNRLGESFRGNLFGIVQGNFYEDLRRESALTISEMDFPGIAIGGLLGGLMGISYIYSINPFWGFIAGFLIAGLVGTARVELRRHTLGQVFAGFALGFACTFVSSSLSFIYLFI